MTLDGGRISITALSPLTARQHPPILPFLLAYMSGLCGFFPATRHFIAPSLLPLGLFLFALFLTHRKTRGSIIVLFLAGFGYLVPALPDLTRPSNHILNHIQEGRTTVVQGRLFSSPRVLADRTYYLLELESLGAPSIPVTGTVRVSIYKPHAIFKAGDRVRLNKIRLKIPRNFKNPGRFDYHLYLKSKGIDVTGNISRPETMERLGRFDLPFWHVGLQQLRSRLVESLEKLFPGEEGALLKAMVLGMKDSLPMEVRENYIATGLAHLMAVSGLYIGFVAAASYFLLWPVVFFILFRLNPDSARAGHTRKITAILCLIPVLFYMVVVGPKVSSLRAGIMVSALLIAILVDRQSSLFNVFLTAGFIILLWKPESIMDAGFQLSFLAVGGILLVFTRLSQISSDPVARMGEPTWLQKLMGGTGVQEPQEFIGQYLKSRFEKILIGGALISVTVTAVTFPVLVYQFNRGSLVGVFLNILMVPLASLLIPTVLLMTLVGNISTTLAALPAWPMLRVLLRCFLAKVRSPKEVLETINHILCENQKLGHFITAFYGVIHLPSRKMKYASAGHNPPLLIDYGTGSIQHLKTKKGFPLMINSHNEIEELETLLSPNSKLICYTNGFTEARGKGTDMYGLNRLGQKSLELGKSRNADELGRALKQDAQDFLDGGDFTDDFTLVIVEAKG